MKKSAKIIGSIASIAMSASLIVGGTYALFTSESKVNIAVTSGKVKVIATIDEDFTTYSMNEKTAVNGVFYNQGTAAFNKNSDLVLERVSPGDKVEFDINVDNQSNIDIQYRVSMNVEGELADALVSTVDGVTFMDGQASAWTFDGYKDNEDSEEDFVIPVSIELPVAVGDEYQESNANVTFKVEAVQANGITQVATVDDLKAALAEGQSVDLASDIELTEAISITGNAAIYGNGNKITSSYGRGFEIAEAGASLTLDGVVLDMTSATAVSGNVRGINVTTTDAVVNLSNSTIRTAADNDNYGINLNGQTSGVTVNVENSTIEAFQCINVYGPNATINLTDSTLVAVDNGNTVYARQGIMGFVNGLNINDAGANGTNLTINTYGATAIVDGSPEVETTVSSNGSLHNAFVAVENPKAGAAAVNNYGTLVINDGMWVNENTSAQGGAVISNYGELVINGGTIGSDKNRGAAVENYGELVVNGGTFATIDRSYGGSLGNGDAFAYVFINKSGTMTVNYATVDGDPNGIFYAATGSTIVVNDGSYEIGDGEKNTWYVAYAEDGAEIVLNGGTYVWLKPSWNTIAATSGNVTVSDACVKNW